MKDIIVPLFVVVLVILGAYYTTRWISKKQNSFTSGKLIHVLERVMLSKDVFIVVVAVDTKVFLMSVTNCKNELLTELPAEIIEHYNMPKQTSPDFTKIWRLFLDNHGNNKNSKIDSEGDK